MSDRIRTSEDLMGFGLVFLLCLMPAFLITTHVTSTLYGIVS